jgi:hypothetical protein
MKSSPLINIVLVPGFTKVALKRDCRINYACLLNFLETEEDATGVRIQRDPGSENGG